MSAMAVESTGSFEPLLHRLEDLERRVLNLEQRPEHHAGAAPMPLPTPQFFGAEHGAEHQAAAGPVRSASVQPISPGIHLNAVSLGGVSGSIAKAVLGLAGAYFLRAGAESGWFPHSAGILAGFIYAVSWLIAAGKTDTSDHPTSTVYSLISCIVLVGLILQEAVRSAVLAASIAAILIVVYLCAGQVVAWFNNRREIAAVTVASTTALSLVLFLATYNFVLFAVSLLCVAAASEFAACRGRWLGQRCIPALGADLAIFITAWIINQSATLPEGYAPFGRSSVLAIQLALVFVYLASMGFRTLAARNVASAFEIGQSVLAVGLFILGQVILAPACRQRFVAGVTCFILAKLSYAASILFARRGAKRNSLIFGVFGPALQITAILVVLPPHVRVFALCALGAGTAWFAARKHQVSLQWHAPLYLIAAAWVSGLIHISCQSLPSVTVPHTGEFIAMIVITVASGLAYVWVSSGHLVKERIPSLLCAAVILSGVLGLGTIAIKAASAALQFATSLQIGLICSTAVVSTRWTMLSRSPRDGVEWFWLAYPLMLYAGWRLLVEDLPNGRPAASALSLLFYGATLLLLTRNFRRRERA